MNEPDIFAQPKAEAPARENNPEKENLRARALEWITGHPREAGLMLKWARELSDKGRRFGVGLLTERLRWEAASEGWEGQDYKVNNNHRAYIARWMIAQDPGLEPYLAFRETQW